jgi:hypothetical protein
MIDPEGFGGGIGKDILIREIAIFPKNPAKRKVAPEVIIGYVV